MADKINIENLEAGRGACDSLEKIVQDIDVARQSSTSTLATLTSIVPDMGTHFINELTRSLDDIYKFLKEDIYSTADKYYQQEDDGNPGDNNGGNGGNNGGYPGGNGGNNGRGTEPETIPTTVPETQPITDPSTIIKNINLKELEEVKLSDLYGLVIQLVGLIDPKKGTLDEIFADDINADNIKKLVLESPYVPDGLKKQLTDLDSKVVKQLIYNILKGDNPKIFDLNDLNKVAFYKYLEIVAKNNNITVEELLGDSKNVGILRDAMEGLDDAVELIKGWEEQTNETFQEQLKLFYFGDVPNEFPDQDIYVTRAYVDYLADECEISYEELLNDSSYAEVLKKGAQEFGKSLTFFNSTSFFSDKTMQEKVSSTLKDVNVIKGTAIDDRQKPATVSSVAETVPEITIVNV